jgi:heme/copper-type cytochrome/quinol oxidase subunit 1
MMWTVAFMVTFAIGGMTGVLLAVPPADFVLHNSLFLIAHFHNVIIGGVVFAVFAGINYWFPRPSASSSTSSGASARSGSGWSASGWPSRRCTSWA